MSAPIANNLYSDSHSARSVPCFIRSIFSGFALLADYACIHILIMLCVVVTIVSIEYTIQANNKSRAPCHIIKRPPFCYIHQITQRAVRAPSCPLR